MKQETKAWFKQANLNLDAMYNDIKAHIVEYLKEEHDGFLVFRQPRKGEYWNTPRVITIEGDPNYVWDDYLECFCYALKLDEQDNILMFCDAIHSQPIRWSVDDILDEKLTDGMWYKLDWDEANVYQYNIERILHFLEDDCDENSDIL